MIGTSPSTGRARRSGCGSRPGTGCGAESGSRRRNGCACSTTGSPTPRPVEAWPLAGWFSRWAPGPWPLGVDRLALGSAGLGPKSPCDPSRVEGNGRSISAAALKQHNLTLVSFPASVLITTEREAERFRQPSRWAVAIAETLSWGSDRTDRFQTLARWPGEPSPRTGLALGDDSSEPVQSPPGWSAWRFSGAGWPGNDAFIHLIDVPRRILTGWILAGLGLSALIGSGRLLSRWRTFVLAG